MNVGTSFIIVSYHQSVTHITQLIHVLRSYRVIVVDNSEEPTRKLALGKNVAYLFSGKNRGYGGGANIGLTHAFRHGAEWGVVLNQDIAFSSTAIEKFIKQLGDEPAVAGPVVGRLDKNRWSTIIERSLGHARDDTTRYVSGECMAIHKKVFEKISGFFEPYYMYYEDVDYSIRANNAGFPLYSIPVVGMNHMGTSLGKGSSLHEYYLARNHMLFIERLAPLSVRFYEWARLLKTFIEYLQNRNSGAIRGLRDYILRKFGKGTV